MGPTAGIGTIALVLLAGCASDAAEPTATSSVTATSTVGPTRSAEGLTAAPSTPATLSRDEAAARFLQIVGPYNEALEALEQAVNGGQPLGTLTSLAEVTAAANQAHIRDLQATAWPAEVRAPLDELVDQSTQAQRYWEQAAQASTRDQLIRALLAAAEHDGTTAANTIRRLLHLDEYDEDDYSD